MTARHGLETKLPEGHGVTWVKLDDGFPDHDKVRKLSDAAFRSYVTALCFSARARLDGRVPSERVKQWVGTPKRVEELVAARLLDRDEAGELTIHDFLKFNPSKAQIDAEREAAKERMQRLRSPEHPSNGSPSPSRPVPEVLSEPPKATTKRVTEVDEPFRARMVEQYADIATAEEVNGRIDDALSHNSRRKWTDIQRYVQNWLRDDHEFVRRRQRTTGGGARAQVRGGYGSNGGASGVARVGRQRREPQPIDLPPRPTNGAVQPRVVAEVPGAQSGGGDGWGAAAGGGAW